MQLLAKSLLWGLVLSLPVSVGFSWGFSTDSSDRGPIPTAPPPPISVCLLFLARDAEDVLRRHLPLWAPLLASNDGCLAAAVDDRTQDLTEQALVNDTALPGVPFSRRHVFRFHLAGVASARTLLLDEAWWRFGATATHFLLADQGWQLQWQPYRDAASFTRGLQQAAQTQTNEMVFAFQVRSREETRWLDWCVRAVPGLSFRQNAELAVPPHENRALRRVEDFVVVETQQPLYGSPEPALPLPAPVVSPLSASTAVKADSITATDGAASLPAIQEANPRWCTNDAAADAATALSQAEALLGASLDEVATSHAARWAGLDRHTRASAVGLLAGAVQGHPADGALVGLIGRCLVVLSERAEGPVGGMAEDRDRCMADLQVEVAALMKALARSRSGQRRGVLDVGDVGL